jgi:tRNA threonylcarbamoyladenosine biosynthesis protein TsaB
LNDDVLTEQFEVIGRGHAEHLLPMINAVLEEADSSLNEVELFAFGAGPGSFTGLRIGAAMMQGLALARERQIITISSLVALAVRQQEGLVLSAIDARMDQVYCALYQINKKNEHEFTPELINEIEVLSVEDIVLPEQGEIRITGTGWERYRVDFLQMQTDKRTIIGTDNEYPHAAEIARLALYEFNLGKADEPEQALPQYVRNKVAKTMAERQA